MSAHDQAVQRLLDSYRQIPAGQPVRLAKSTSNLFRPRTDNAAPGLDVSGLTDVLSVDAQARTADVQGMCTYERLVEVTLAHGLMPLVVPQLRTITLGGAVSGLGIESSSWREGLPHESVLELDILTGAGEIVTATPTQHEDLFRGFPNSYGTLGYATRVRIELAPVSPYVALRHVRFSDPESCCAAVETIMRDRRWEDDPVDFLDGVMFEPGEVYLTLGRWSDGPAQPGDDKPSNDKPSDDKPSDYTGQRIYYRSLRERATDVLTVHDYLWRWDTDWFWCSRAFGAQHPLVRRVWPRRWRRSDVYHRIVRLENRHQVMARIDRRRGRPPRERVVQDVEIPLDRTPEFLRWFAAEVGMAPVWLCPLRLRDPAGWPLYPLQGDADYVNVGFWGTVPRRPGSADGDINRSIERRVSDLGGHKSLYSDAYFEPADFWAAYDGDTYATLKKRYDPDARLLDLYRKVVERG